MSNNRNIQVLNLSKSNITDDELIVISNNTKGKNSEITTLDVLHNFIGDTGAVSFSDALLDKYTSVSEIDLSYNKIGSEGMSFIIDALKSNCIVTNIDIEGNVFFQPMKLLQVLLSANRYFKNLDLCSEVKNNIDMTGTEIKLSSLPEAESLLSRWILENDLKIQLDGEYIIGDVTPYLEQTKIHSTIDDSLLEREIITSTDHQENFSPAWDVLDVILIGVFF